MWLRGIDSGLISICYRRNQGLRMLAPRRANELLFGNDAKGNKEYVQQIWEGLGIEENPFLETGRDKIFGHKKETSQFER